VTHCLRLLMALALLFAATAPRAAGIADTYPQLRQFFPAADRFGELEGEPRAAPAYRGGQLLGYAFLSNDVLRIPAYSGSPINTLIGFDLAGRIVGVSIVQHEEPILVIGVTDERLRQFAEQYRGLSVFDRVAVGAPRAGHANVDTIAGATITVMVENATIMRSARQVAEARGLRPASGTGEGTAAVRADDEPLWKAAWQERRVTIALLVAGLAVLTSILVFQDWFAQRPQLLFYVRRGFLVYTVLFVGWYALGQLSVVNVLTFVHAFMRDFNWQNFLIDPMLFILWSFVALTLLLWGRGVYCGWLCPFGAIQELLGQAARYLGLRQFEFPNVVHERLWAVKYLILIVLFGLSLQSLGDAVRYAEVEPFKTAVTLHFQRPWPFVLYAAALIAISAFNRKFFCKYLCPLGAALSIPGRFRVFDWWLRRRKECGRPCQVCANHCEVQAIRPTGEINHNECHYCLDCQVTYYSDRKCTPLFERRVKREQRLVRLQQAAGNRSPGAPDRPQG
jgi:NosR/NirI family transcriptional regulator, nitrous oxide reductase regulator